MKKAFNGNTYDVYGLDKKSVDQLKERIINLENEVGQCRSIIFERNDTLLEIQEKPFKYFLSRLFEKMKGYLNNKRK